MLNSTHPSIRKFVLDYYQDAKSKMRYALIDKIKGGEQIMQCTVPIPLGENKSDGFQEYSGYLFEEQGKQLALISDHLDYSQDVLIDVAKLDRAPILGQVATLDNFQYLLGEDTKEKVRIHIHHKIESDYVKSLYSTCASVMEEYVKLRNTLPLPTLDDPLLSEMVKWKKTNTYQSGYMADFKHQLSKGLSTISNINHLLDKQRHILHHIIPRLTLPRDKFNITRGGLDDVYGQIKRFSAIAKYGLEIAIHVTDKNTVEYTFSDHSHNEVARITDTAGFKRRTAELNGHTYEVLSYELDPNTYSALDVESKCVNLTQKLQPVLDAIATTDAHQGLRLLSMDNSPAAIYAAEESARQAGRPCIALYNNRISSEQFMGEIARHHTDFPQITQDFCKQHVEFAIPYAKQQDVTKHQACELAL